MKFGTICLSLIAIALVFTLPPSPAQAQITLNIDKQLGRASGWRIGYGKTFNGCLASATYRDDTTVWMGTGSRVKFFIAFTNSRWTYLRNGKNYKLRVQLRGFGRWNGTFLGFEGPGKPGYIISALKERFMVGLARSRGLLIRRGKRRIANLSLKGSKKALIAVLKCQKAVRALVAKARKNRDSTATARANKPKQASSGTGFFVSQSGHVMTNHHVVKGCRSLQVVPAGKLGHPARVLASDRRNDLALLATDFKPTTVPAFRSRARVGESVYVFGYPLSMLLASSGNFTIGNITALAGMQDDISQMQISAPVQPGNSGGPLLDKSGNVIGVIVSKLNALKVAKLTNDVTQNVNFAIKATIAANFLETHNLATPDGTAKDRLASEDIAAKAKDFTVRVLCK